MPKTAAIINTLRTSHPHFRSILEEGLWGFPESNINRKRWEKLSIGSQLLIFFEHRGVQGVWLIGEVIDKVEDYSRVKYWTEDNRIYPYRIRFKVIHPFTHHPTPSNPLTISQIDKVKPLTSSELIDLGVTGLKGQRWSLYVFGDKRESGITYDYQLFEKAHEKFLQKNRIQVPEIKDPFIERTEEMVKVLMIHLTSGKNLIISGPPGIGKTKLSKYLVTLMKGEYSLETGNPDWTTFDVIGGITVTGEFRIGFLTQSVVECWNKLSLNSFHWLILDEINRANIDLCFGKAFTLLDPSHRDVIPLLDETDLNDKAPKYLEEQLENRRLYMPYAFRVIGNMNSYDRALLHRLGFALIRRFAIFPMTLNYTLDNNTEKFVEKARKLSEETSETFSEEIVRKELLYARPQKNDYLTLSKRNHELLEQGLISEFIDSVVEKLGFNPLNLIQAMADKINSELSEHVEITPALVLDAQKFIATSPLILGIDTAIEKLRALVDEAVAAYIIPQLDVLTPAIKAEELGLSRSNLRNKINSLTETIRDLELNARTLKLLNKLKTGERVI